MAGSVNKVMLIGRVGRDPDVRNSRSGDGKIVSLSLATSENWRDQSGQRQERTHWHNIVIFDERIADVAAQYVKKGSLIYVVGALQNRKFERNGEERWITEVVLAKFRGELQLLTGGNGQGRSPAPDSADDYGDASGDQVPPRSMHDDLDDNIPF